MTRNDYCKVRSLIPTVTLIAGLSFVTHATALERPILIDLNRKTTTWIGTSDPNLSWVVEGINDSGQVVGESVTRDTPRAFITGPDGMGISDLGSLGSGWSQATDINNAGQVVGGSFTEALTGRGEFHAFITGRDGMRMRDIGTLHNSSFARGVNDAGEVAGVSNDKTAFITGANGIGMRDLGTLGGVKATALGINDVGQVVGLSETAGGRFSTDIVHAFITGPGGRGMRDLGTLGGEESIATDINTVGQVVGYTTAEGISHAFITGYDGIGMRDLGTLGGDYSKADGINAAGQAVGESSRADGTHVAFITSPDGKDMADLNSLVHLQVDTLLTRAVDINNRGQVLAYASVDATAMVTHVPEPETYVLLLAGLCLVGLLVQREKSLMSY